MRACGDSFREENLYPLWRGGKLKQLVATGKYSWLLQGFSQLHVTRTSRDNLLCLNRGSGNLGLETNLNQIYTSPE